MTAPKFDLDAIEAAAKAAVLAETQKRRVAAAVDSEDSVYDYHVTARACATANAAHIAAASPAVVLAMCARLRWAERLEAAAGMAAATRHNEVLWRSLDYMSAVLAEKPE